MLGLTLLTLVFIVLATPVGPLALRYLILLVSGILLGRRPGLWRQGSRLLRQGRVGGVCGALFSCGALSPCGARLAFCPETGTSVD